MTGYGVAEETSPHWTVEVEIRSVNHGELKVSPRLPESLRARESELEKILRREISRGHLYLKGRNELKEESVDLLINHRKLEGYLRAARDAAEKMSMPVKVEVGSVLSLPEVMGTESLSEELQEELWSCMVKATEAALESLVEMRRAEGKALAAELRETNSRLERGVQTVADRTQECLEAYRDRLKKRVEELMEDSEAEADPSALAREVALLAERSDVREEVTRMQSHLEQFENALSAEEGPVGKKLEFIAQEMLRETNTMASKLPCHDLVEVAVDLKTDVQRLREQVRNVE
jgi:uncharacterized protein (TIGR00255 family)